ncbi:MAG: threonine--tRNA ligase [Actinobacteria bacterium]|nr:threonine--tRNA ligase [Actinomycetota bacterium]
MTNPEAVSEGACYRLPDGSLVDVASSPSSGELISQSDPVGREVVRHSTAHVLAQAVLSLYPGAKYAIGPPVSDPPGFYYDFDIGRPFTPEDLEQIEAKMREIIEADQPFTREEVTITVALDLFADQPYKREILEGIGEESASEGVAGDKVSLYRNDGFVDLCRGPHLPSTGRIHAFQLLKTSGAYWRGDEKRQMLQRIYGTAWESQEALDDYLQRKDEAEQRDHVRLGRQLEIFANFSQLPAGFPVWLPKGATIRRLLEEFILEEERRAGYQHVVTPHVGKKELYETSGHWEHFRDNMFPPIELEHESLVLKPMNCPHHILIYASELRSYRDLPLRIAELGAMYRYERSGTLRGLNRVRYMILNDAHIFCTREQIKEEFTAVVKMVERVYGILGITNYNYRLSLRDSGDTEKYHGDAEMWEQAESLLRESLLELGVPFREAEGEANFYGPKLDIQLVDLLGREETYSTVQLDFLLPKRFELTYIGDDGNEHRPVMVHRGIISTLERIVSYLIELYGGAFPVWFAPVQALVIPIADRHHEYANQLVERISSVGGRAAVDASGETLGNRIRKAQGQKVPYMLVVGDKELEAGTVSVRLRSGEEKRGVPAEEFVSNLVSDVEEKRLSQ